MPFMPPFGFFDEPKEPIFEPSPSRASVMRAATNAANQGPFGRFGNAFAGASRDAASEPNFLGEIGNAFAQGAQAGQPQDMLGRMGVGLQAAAQAGQPAPQNPFGAIGSGLTDAFRQGTAQPAPGQQSPSQLLSSMNQPQQNAARVAGLIGTGMSPLGSMGQAASLGTAPTGPTVNVNGQPVQYGALGAIGNNPNASSSTALGPMTQLRGGGWAQDVRTPTSALADMPNSPSLERQLQNMASNFTRDYAYIPDPSGISEGRLIQTGNPDRRAAALGAMAGMQNDLLRNSLDVERERRLGVDSAAARDIQRMEQQRQTNRDNTAMRQGRAELIAQYIGSGYPEDEATRLADASMGGMVSSGPGALPQTPQAQSPTSALENMYRTRLQSQGVPIPGSQQRAVPTTGPERNSFIADVVNSLPPDALSGPQSPATFRFLQDRFGSGVMDDWFGTRFSPFQSGTPHQSAIERLMRAANSARPGTVGSTYAQRPFAGGATSWGPQP